MIKLGTVALSGFNAARGFVGGAAAPSLRRGTDFAGFNAARGFVGGAAPVKRGGAPHFMEFQCRTRLCGWCSGSADLPEEKAGTFQCRTRLCGWCSVWKKNDMLVERIRFNAARGFVGGAASSLSALVPLRGKRPFGKSPEI